MDEIFRLEKPSLLIGRGQHVDIQLSSAGISRQHARIDRHDNSFIITDLNSLNGTQINENRIQQSALQEGDKVTVGEAEFRFCFLSEDTIDFHSTLKESAVYDHLTQVTNKSFFLEMLRKETSYALRQGQNLSCIMLDIDRLQKINVEHGVEAGDVILRKVAQSLNEGLRSYDILCRYGGEEFVILLRDTALDNALVFSDRILKRVSRLLVPFAGKSLSVTISVGVSHLNPDQIQDAYDLIREADRHLQTAKMMGGNRVCSQRTKL